MKPTSRFVAGSLLVASLLTAQDPVPSGKRLPALRTPIHTAAPDRGIEYGIWAAGDSYKVSFHGGMTFVPYLGTQCPVTQSLHWRTSSARLGTHELIENTSPAPVQSEWRYEYRFGPLTEAYDVRLEGLEQTFVLHQRPAAGDLVIRGVVTSPMRTSNVAPAHQALVFADDHGRPLVEYGSAIAFDARGDRVPVATSCSDGVIALTVPGAWLEHALLPVTVDPLLARVQLADWGGANGEVEDVDIACRPAAGTNNILVTYTRSVSAADSDLWVRVFHDDFGHVANNLLYADIDSATSDQTCCAFVGGINRWVVVYRRLVSSFSEWSELRCHVHDVSNTSLSTNYGALTSPQGINDWRPDVGGVRSSSPGNNALVVFQREDNTATPFVFENTGFSEVRGSLLDVSNGSFGSTFAIKANATLDNERPSVNQAAEGGSTFSWVCVFQRIIEGVTNDDWDLIGARVSHNGNVASGSWTSDLDDASPSLHQLGPIVEGANGRYAVAFATVDVASVSGKPTAINGKKVQLERFDWNDAAASPSGDRANVELDTSGDRRFEVSGLGHDPLDRSHWSVGIREVSPGSPGLAQARVGFRGERTAGANLYYIGGNTPGRAACAFSAHSESFHFVYGVDNGGNHPVFGHTVTYEVPPAEVNFGTSCSGATLDWLGNQQIGAELNSVNVSGTPPTAIHIMLLSLAPQNVPLIHPIVASGCRLLVDIGPSYLGSFPIAIGTNATWELPLPEFLQQQDLFFQDWYLDATGLLYSTERIKVPIVK